MGWSWIVGIPDGASVISLVCGFGRCGTSLAMQMLAAGGYENLWARRADYANSQKQGRNTDE